MAAPRPLETSPIERIAALIDPAKLATLAQRGANPRVQKYVAQLEEARVAGWDPVKVAVSAVARVGMQGDAARLTVEAMLRNLTIAHPVDALASPRLQHPSGFMHEVCLDSRQSSRLGCLTPAGLHDMRRGQSPTITLGPYAGDELSVDHIIPLAVAPQLDHVIANLELMPLKMNIGKGARMGERQHALAKRLRSAGLF
jgi:hypothetical protein